MLRIVRPILRWRGSAWSRAVSCSELLVNGRPIRGYFISGDSGNGTPRTGGLPSTLERPHPPPHALGQVRQPVNDLHLRSSQPGLDFHVLTALVFGVNADEQRPRPSLIPVYGPGPEFVEGDRAERLAGNQKAMASALRRWRCSHSICCGAAVGSLIGKLARLGLRITSGRSCRRRRFPAASQDSR